MSSKSESSYSSSSSSHDEPLSMSELEMVSGGSSPFIVDFEMPVNLNAPSTVSEVNAQGGLPQVLD